MVISTMTFIGEKKLLPLFSVLPFLSSSDTHLVHHTSFITTGHIPDHRTLGLKHHRKSIAFHLGWSNAAYSAVSDLKAHKVSELLSILVLVTPTFSPHHQQSQV